MMLPADCYPDSRNRLPLVQREALSDIGKDVYDDTVGDARSFVGLLGPGGIRMRAPRLAQLMRPVNRYLRFECGLDQRLAEIAILATARENDQHFEWSQHERLALKAGVQPEIIDVIRHRGPLSGLGEREATLIALTREAIGDHAVGPATFATALRLFGEEQLVLFVSLVGHYSATAYLLTVFNNQLAEGEESRLPSR